MTQTSDRLFHKNIELWKKTCPREATLLSYVELVQTVTPKAKSNQKWLTSLPLDTVKLVILYGIHNGSGYTELLPWLKKNVNHHVVFFEDNIQSLRSLFETTLGKEILENPQARILYLHNITKEDPTLQAVYWHFIMTPFVVTTCDPTKKHERFEELHQKILHDMSFMNALTDEYMKYGFRFYVNFYQNLLHLPQSYLGTQLFGKFNEIPAIICGAGPSLSKNCKLLHQLRDKALIFAGGSALNALTAEDVYPHFGAGIDPNPSQYERLKASKGHGIPFFYRNRMNHEAFMALQGPKLYIPGAGGYDTATYFDEKLKIPGASNPIDEGHNVVNFCAEIAYAMGCNPIVFVGMDLAFTDMKQYASGVIKDPSVVESVDAESDNTPIEKTDIFGKPTKTLWKWVTESEWIGNFAKEHPMIQVFNCTEGGLGFPGVPNKMLQEVAEKHLVVSYSLKEKVNVEIKKSSLKGVTQRKIVNLMQALRKSLEAVVDDFAILKEEERRAITKTQQNNVAVSQSGRAALAETELVEEIGYKYVVDIFNEIYARVLSREGHALSLKKGTKQQMAVDLLELSLKKYEFLQEVAKFNGLFIDYARSEFKKKK